LVGNLLVANQQRRELTVCWLETNKGGGGVGCKPTKGSTGDNTCRGRGFFKLLWDFV